MLVKAVDGLRNRLRETHPARNRSSPLATDLHQFADPAVAAVRHLNQSADAFQKRRSGRDMSQRVLQTLPAHTRPVREFDIALGPDLIRRQNMKQFGRVAAAPGVFEQQGVKEVPLLGGGKPDVAGEAHAEYAGAHGMPMGRPSVRSRA